MCLLGFKIVPQYVSRQQLAIFYSDVLSDMYPNHFIKFDKDHIRVMSTLFDLPGKQLDQNLAIIQRFIFWLALSSTCRTTTNISKSPQVSNTSPFSFLISRFWRTWKMQ